ncbi:DENN domain-containing protein 5B-like [Solea senegalensis]|uniref:DENN domain-containing protein 5B-like n=1 Tax=Solea senegalensis TaxID=28829 RepID=A0AAV6SYX2_SOLSE|nr:DENN domain-containing protein 5B-like [Solea senegalensis]KAG7522364.1 DENN domain-containing protein 5B-like [Solea senegalensis]
MSGTAAATGSGTASSCRFAHYFVVCGVDADTGLEPDDGAGDSFEQSPIRRSFKSKVLVRYPENTDRSPFNKDAVNMLCMPRGLSFRTQADRLDPQFHSFTLSSDDGTRSYGFVHTLYEEVTDPKIIIAMQTLSQMHHVEHQSSSSASSPSSSTSSSTSPSTSSMDSLVSSLDESDAESLAGISGCLSCVGSFDPVRDTLYVSKALCLLTPLPFLQASRQFLAQLHQAVMSHTAPPLPLESYIHNILYEVPVPPPGRSLRFHGVHRPIVCQRPGPGELPLGEYPLGEAFSLLGVDNMVQLLTCAFLETQVLLYSQDYQRLMTVAEGVATLLFPFQWQHIYLPIISAPLHHLLDAPVPFLMGLQRREGAQRSSLHLPHEANLCFVDIDNQCVEAPEDLPAFPDQTELIRELSEVLQHFGLPLQGGVTTKPPTTTTTTTTSSPNVSSLVLEDLMEDRRNGNLGGEELAVLERLQALARRCGGGKMSDDRQTLGRVFAEEEEELKAAKLNIQLREVFAGRLAAMFGRYDEFVIHSALDLDSWLSNREGTFSFDKGSFLSAQPMTHLRFLSRFLETSMFSNFVDGKVISHWAERDPLQQLFDNRVEKERLYDTDKDSCNCHYRKSTTLFESAQATERRLLKADHTAIHPHLLDMRIGQGRHQPGFFPKLQADVLTQGQNTNKWSSRVTASRRTEPKRWTTSDHSGVDNEPRQKHTFMRKNLRQSKLLDPSPEAVTQTHREFVDGLLSECRLKTKRMLMERMGKESVELGQGEANITGLQENTLIHGLCDLLERTWGHGLQLKQGKSALWSHLLHYQAAQGKMEAPAESPGSDQRTNDDGALLLRGSLIQDMRFIQTMSEGLSEVGQARAWIHLALEKKMLSQHLKELLTNQNLLRQLYKPHAFLLCEEEREQFLFHLLSLNTVDYLCFTRVFTSISIPYRVVIVPMKKLSIAMATVNPWVCVSGELGDSGVIQMPKNTQEIFFQCNNLGRLSTLQLGQENSGLLAKCLIDCVMVYNEITGHTYRFPCGRWLGKGVGDGSLERVLIGQLVSPGGEDDAGRWTGTPPELTSPSQSVRAVLGSLGSRGRLLSVEVQESMREAANNLVKHFHKPEQERGNLTVLLCGEGGLVLSLENFLLHGFKSNRLFQRNVFVWDFVEKAVISLETADQMGDMHGSTLTKGPPGDSLCHYVTAINASPRSIGKEGKFQLFVCLGIRDRLLSQWLPLLAECPLTARTYEEGALLRDRAAVHSLSRILHTLNDFTITLETALVKGIDL